MEGCYVTREYEKYFEFRLDTNELSIRILLHVKICKKLKSIESSFFFFFFLKIKYVQRRIFLFVSNIDNFAYFWKFLNSINFILYLRLIFSLFLSVCTNVRTVARKKNLFQRLITYLPTCQNTISTNDMDHAICPRCQYQSATT